MAPRILIFSIAMVADHLFYVKIIENHARAILPLNILAIGTTAIRVVEFSNGGYKIKKFFA
jgi:hypothetical protein